MPGDLRLTAKDRILLHLLEFAKYAESPEVPPAMTQAGIALASWIDDRHIPQNIRPLLQEGLVRGRTVHIKGGTQRRKVYDLTDSGRLTAARLREAVRAEPVQVRDGSGVHESTVSQVLQEVGGTRSLLEIAHESVETGVVDLSTLVSPAETTAEIVPPEGLRLEREYNWTGAVDAYKIAIASTAKHDFQRQGPLYERLGYALHRAAMQAAQLTEFRGRMQEAIESCEKARDAYVRSGKSENSGAVLRCQATSAYMRFWLATALDDRRKNLEKAWELTKAALAALEEPGDAREYGTTKNRLSLVPVLRLCTEWDIKPLEPVMREAVEEGERAIRALSASADHRELAKAYVRTAADLNLLAARLSSIEERGELFRKVAEYWHKARELSEETALLEPFTGPAVEGDGTDRTLATLARALDYAKATGDHFALGWVLESLAYHRYWKSMATEDLDQWRGVLKKGLEDSEDSKRQFALVALPTIMTGSFTGEIMPAQYFYELSRRELAPGARYDLLSKSLEAARDGVRRTEEFGFPDDITGAWAMCCDVLIGLSEIEQNTERRRRWTEEALRTIDEVERMVDQRDPASFFNRGDVRITRARARAQLADLSESPEVKIGLLRDAVQDAETGLAFCAQDMVFYGSRGEVAGYVYICSFVSDFADMYAGLHELTGDKTYLRRGTDLLERVADLFRRADLPSRVAEFHWQAAKIYDSLEDHMEAAKEFSFASATYKAATVRVPQLQDLYQDLALYMQAWSEIEKARHHHSREEYGQARDFYERAATIHRLTKGWGFMAPNYAAWAQVEEAEDLSRAERTREAIEVFKRADELFREARVSLEGARDSLRDLEERKMVEALVKAAERRSRYCAARIALEEARVLDKKGEYSSCSQRYGEAAGGFEKLVAEAESNRDRRDLSLIATLAKAWGTMAKAEADASPDLYAEAARFFEAARELSPSEKAKALALGHGRFCQALEAGTRFADVRDPALYAAAVGYLESAASHYARAGVETASEYAQASKCLFDAYAAMDRANLETDPERKTKAYLAVEKILEASAAAFGKAEQAGKKDQTLRLLGHVKRERDLATSLTEVFRAPLIVSSPAAFAAPAPSYEHAVGMETLEHADIRARLTPSVTELAVGEELELTLEFANAGRAAGQLVDVEGFVPRDFELEAVPEKCELDGDALNLKGRLLEPLKTDQVRIILRPHAKGVVSLRPRIVYLDELGNRKSHELAPVEVNVSE